MFGDVEITDKTTPAADGTSPPPLRAFSLRSALGSSQCSAAPENGIMIQTPKGQGTVYFNINGASLALNSTAFVQAQPGGVMTVSVVEGQVSVTADGDWVWVPAGAQVADFPRMAMASLWPAKGILSPYDDLAALAAPVQLLPLSFAVPVSMSEQELSDYVASSLFSQTLGNACVPGGVSTSMQVPPDEPKPHPHPHWPGRDMAGQSRCHGDLYRRR